MEYWKNEKWKGFIIEENYAKEVNFSDIISKDIDGEKDHDQNSTKYQKDKIL